jgi:tetratricopeptide (TPR) repeat protein
VREICRRLDCLPLAIELAAARVRTFPPVALLARLDDRFQLLTAGSRTGFARQQTLRAVIDWSYDLLFESERRVFERVSVFAGAFTVEAAEAVCGDSAIGEHDVAELLARLVDKSLVTPNAGGADARFRLLQTLAQYGRERLERSGDADATRARHAAYIAKMIEVTDPSHGSVGGEWFGFVTRSLDDIRAAMEWAITTRDADVACALGAGLGWNWNMGGRIEDTWKWLSAAVSLDPPRDRTRRVRALAWASMVGVGHDSDVALAYGAQAVAEAREIGDPGALALAGTLYGSVLNDAFGRADAAAEIFAECIGAFRTLGDAWSQAMTDLLEGAIALIGGDYDTALTSLRSGADRFGQQGNAWGRSIALRHLADIARTRGRYDEAERALRDAAAGLQSVGVVGIATGVTARLAYVCALQGNDAEADVWFERALEAADRQRYVPTLALAHNLWGIALRRRGKLDAAERCHLTVLALCEDRSADAGLDLALASLGYIAELRGDAATAAVRHRAGLDAASDVGEPNAQALALEGLAGVASLEGDDATVGLMLGAADALRDRGGGPLVAAERLDVDRALSRVADRDAYDTAYARGRADPQAALGAARATEHSPAR